MKKDLYNYLGIAFPQSIDLTSLSEDSVEKSDSEKGILQAIYALDPVTRLPTGDIMCYMSPNTPPEIKQYIMDSIMIDTSSQALPPLPDGLDEDTAFALERKVGENVDVYRERINQFMQHQVNIRDMAIENAKREKQASQQADE